ncbi:MAG: FMN-binding protein [Desulfobacterales bacterium]
MTSSMSATLKDNNIVQAWLVLLLAICFGGLLAGIQLGLGPRIEQNKLNETREKVPELVLGAETAGQPSQDQETMAIDPLTITVEKPSKLARYSVFQAKKDGVLAGWVVKTAGQGYADKIEILVGLSPDASRVTGLFVLDQKETPGLGNKIVTDDWRGQFVGKSTETPFEPVKGGAKADYEIDAITGATISSVAVASIINAAVSDLKEPLRAKAGGQN